MRNKLLVKYGKDMLSNFFYVENLSVYEKEELERQLDDFIDQIIEQNTF